MTEDALGKKVLTEKAGAGLCMSNSLGERRGFWREPLGLLCGLGVGG